MTAAMTGATGAMTAKMTGVTGEMTAKTAVPDPDCSGDSPRTRSAMNKNIAPDASTEPATDPVIPHRESGHVSEPADPETLSADQSGDVQEKVPITARLLLHESFTARRAAGTIAAFTLLITVTGGILERVVDHQEFPTIGKGLWFALQTVTTSRIRRRHAQAGRRTLHRRGRDARGNRLPRRDHRVSHRIADRKQPATVRRRIRGARTPAGSRTLPTGWRESKRPLTSRRHHPHLPRANDSGSLPPKQSELST